MPISKIGNYSQEHWAEMREILCDCISSIDEFKFLTKMVSDADDIGVIQRTIVQNLYKCDVVVCDISGKNPNVMFELGMRLAFDKSTVIIKDDTTDYNFDTGIIEHLTYPRDHRYSQMRVFTEKLKEKVLATYKAAVENPKHSVFLKNFGDFETPLLMEKTSPKDLLVIKNLLHIVIQNQNKETHQSTDELVSSMSSVNTVHITSIDKHDFFNYYQPIVDGLKNIVGLETLVRQKGSTSAPELPDAFLPQIKEAGLLNNLQAVVIASIESDYRSWLDQGLIIPRISINLSGCRLNDEKIYDAVQSLVGATHGNIEIEISETELLNEPQEVKKIVQRFRDLGVSFAIDNFGIGYSSLSHLKIFESNRIKIDRSFIRGLIEDKNDQAIVQAIIALSHLINAQVAAQGVETETQATCLIELGCDEMQGFLFGKPIPAKEITELLKDGRAA